MKTILVIDDQKDNLVSMKAVIKLQFKDISVVFAENGPEGISKAREFQPDLILLDIIMPGMDGFETCTHLKNDERTSHIPILMVTAIKTDMRNKIRALELGADAFLSKPIDPVEITTQIKVMLRIKEAEDRLREYNQELQQKVDRTEDKLITSENKYELLFQSTGIGIGYYQTDGTIISYNAKAASIFNAKPEHLIGRNVMDVFPKEYAIRFFERIRKVENGATDNTYVDKVNLGKQVFWLHTVFNSVHDKSGKIIGILVSSDDISQEKEQEQLIRESEYKYRSTIQDLLTGIVIHDPTGKAVFCNPEASRMLKISMDDIKDRAPDEFGWSLINDKHDTLPIEEYPVMKALKTKKPITNYYLGIQFDHSNQITWAIVNASPILNQENEIEKVVVNFLDITDWKKSQQIQNALYQISKISEADLTLRGFLQKIHQEILKIINTKNFYIALYQKDTDKYTFPYFIDETETYESDEAQILKGSLTDYVRRTGKGRIITEDTEKTLSVSEDIKLIGSPSPVWLGAPLYNSVSKEVIGVLAVQDYHDKHTFSERDLEILEILAYNIGGFIERRQNHVELEKAKKKAEESDRLKTAFLANMSHEIRTPMNGILGFSQLLSDPDTKEEERNQYISIINKSGERLMGIINDLVDISKIEAGQVEPVFAATNILEDLNFIYSFFKPGMKQKGLEFTANFKGFTIDNQFFTTDKEKFLAILTNLLKNAMKYTHQGRVEFHCERRENKLICSIKDTGIGIPEDRIEAVFERFIQADIEDTHALEGAGLGLSISKAYSEILGGKLWAESTLGSGSCFYLEIPDQKLDESMPIINVLHKPGNKKNKQLIDAVILIAEDEETSELYLREIIKNKCKEIIHVPDGKQAVECMKARTDVDIILMDIKMPGIDGLEATRQIRQFNKEVPVIAQTAYAMTGDREKALEAGCTGYITKPVDAKLLLDTLSKSI